MEDITGTTTAIAEDTGQDHASAVDTEIDQDRQKGDIEIEIEMVIGTDLGIEARAIMMIETGGIDGERMQRMRHQDRDEMSVVKMIEIREANLVAQRHHNHEALLTKHFPRVLVPTQSARHQTCPSTSALVQAARHHRHHAHSMKRKPIARKRARLQRLKKILWTQRTTIWPLCRL